MSVPSCTYLIIKLSVLTIRYKFRVEKPLYFAPFGQIEFAHFGHNIITPCKVLV